jgi:hypothetical protein
LWYNNITKLEKTTRINIMALTDLKTLEQIANTIDPCEYEYGYIGLRVVNDKCDGYDLSAGDTAPNSYTWDDGEWTDYELDGACCINLDYFSKSSPWPMAYIGRRVWLVAGDYAQYGVDDGELIIKNAKILAVYDVDNLVLS